MTAQAYIMCYKFKVKGEYEWNTSEDGETSFPVKFDVRPSMIQASENGHYRLRGLSRGAQIEAYAWLDDQPSTSPLSHFGFWLRVNLPGKITPLNYPMEEMKKYTVTYDDEGPVEVELTINHMAEFFIQTRGFPQILRLGPLAGGGQSGGRFITDCAKQLEALIIEDLGIDEYRNQMDKILGK